MQLKERQALLARQIADAEEQLKSAAAIQVSWLTFPCVN
jgi:hypothetical protein